MIFYVDEPSQIVLNVPLGNFWQRGIDGGYWKANDTYNMWQYAEGPAPFNQEFYIILNLAVGGTAGNADGYFPDGVGNKPWSNVKGDAAGDFWRAKDTWLPSWQDTDGKISDNAALQIDSVHVWSLTPPNQNGASPSATSFGPVNAAALQARVNELEGQKWAFIFVPIACAVVVIIVVIAAARHVLASIDKPRTYVEKTDAGQPFINYQEA
eukprot:JP446050.1.p1 GENE.JP446050.1~~JP446050.1.p1  ORF type:complete len:211 (-),score=56.58 JP446050.1:466-1098(-)